jgi:hypothetical protein
MVSFEIHNIDYNDLSEQTCPKKTVSHGAGSSGVDYDDDTDDDGEDEGPKDVIDHVMSGTKKLDKDMTKGIKNGVDGVREKIPPLPWMEKGGALLQQANACVLTRRTLKATRARSKHCETVMEVFRRAIKEVVTDIITCMSITPAEEKKIEEYELALPPGIAAAPAAATSFKLHKHKKRGLRHRSTAFLDSSAPAPAPMAPVPQALVGSNVEIMVSFMPGESIGMGKSIIVDVGVMSLAAGGSVDHLKGFEDLLNKAIASGALAKEIEQALQLITGIAPKIDGFVLKHEKFAPFNMTKCEGHVKSIVKQFAKTYTKERVPMALYNECTNFMTKISFSNDRILDQRDTQACKETTASFAKHWKFGEKAADYDFMFMCRRACQAKFGELAQMCQVPGGPGPAPAPVPAPA